MSRLSAAQAAVKTSLRKASTMARQLAGALALGAVMLGVVSPARADYAYAMLHPFEDPPRNPSSALVMGSNGTLYGTAYVGGTSGRGIIFNIGEDGSGFTVLHDFGQDPPSGGVAPYAALVRSGGAFYGTTFGGGTHGYGTLFKLGEDGSGFTVLHNFDLNNPSDGTGTQGALISVGGVLYGTTASNIDGYGTVFKMKEDGSGFTILRRLSSPDGTNPYAGLVWSNGVLYGTAATHGPHGYGTVFRMGDDGSGFAVLHSFDVSTGSPFAELAISGSVLYGTTGGTGISPGIVFKIGQDGSGFTVLHTFNDTTSVQGAVVSSGGVLYGTTMTGGAYGAIYGGFGTVFKMAEDGSGFAVLHDFDKVGGAAPRAVLLPSGGFFYGAASLGGAAGEVYSNLGGYGTIFKIAADGSGFATLRNFSDTKGTNPQTALVASGGFFYGTTILGGTLGNGAVYRVGSDGSGFTILHSFDDTSGSHPYASLVSSGGFLFGSTFDGGAHGFGTLFKIGEDGSGFTVLHDFDTIDGTNPIVSLVSSGGCLFGTTPYGGAAAGGSGYGTLFKIGEDGSGFTVLHYFDNTRPAGALVSSGGVLYGTMPSGGTHGLGSVFRIGEDGAGFGTVHEFEMFWDGIVPGPSVVSAGGVLYGTTGGGGRFGNGTVFKVREDGSGFASLHSFALDRSEGTNPRVGLVESDGVLYGIAGAPEDGRFGYGTAFRLRTDGVGFEIIHRFDDSSGAFPSASLLKAGDALYGTAIQGGPLRGGVIFRLAKNPAVVHPSGGERLFDHASYRIDWTAPEVLTVGGQDVLASADGGLTFDPVPECTGLDAGARSCTWLAPAPPTRLGRIRVVAHDGVGHSAEGVSEGRFTTLAGRPAVTVNTPNTAASWNIGAQLPIRWTHNLGAASAVDIDLSRDGGTTWTSLASGVPNATAFRGQFNWPVGGPETTAASVRVSWSSNPDVADLSDPSFAITEPFLAVTSPARGALWRPGQARVIKWNHNLRKPAAVNIDVSRDGGATWRAIATNVPSSGDSDGTFTWVVTEPATATAIVRVSWTAKPTISGSSGPFAIQGVAGRR
jgi:uncharacterized repeat protein (TIGR03803 family)